MSAASGGHLPRHLYRLGGRDYREFRDQFPALPKPVKRERDRAARRATEGMTVVNYSFAPDRLLVHFDRATLEVAAEPGRVVWGLGGSRDPLPVSAPDPCLVLFEGKEFPEPFDRAAVLDGILGRRAGFGTAGEADFTLFWEGDLQIYLASYPSRTGAAGSCTTTAPTTGRSWPHAGRS